MSQNDTPSLNIAAHPALGGRGGLLSICVVDATSDVLRVATLDQEAEPAKENSHQAIHGPKIFSKKRKTTNEKARSADFRSDLNCGCPCPECESPMLLARIDPEGPTFELRTFECVKCNHVERMTTETKVARTRSSDLRAPT